MLISIWGRDGSGKSTLADYLGSQISKKSLVAVIDTDLTQPTLPIRLPGSRFVKDNSLGRAIAGAGTMEIKRYLHQDPKNDGLFYAGLLNGDDYLAYEIGLEAESTADLFVKKLLSARRSCISRLLRPTHGSIYPTGSEELRSYPDLDNAGPAGYLLVAVGGTAAQAVECA